MRSVLAVFSTAFLAFLGLQFVSSDFVDPDAYYHIVMAELPFYRLSRFPWLSATTLRDEFADLHLLYHLLLRPFVALDRIIGAKVATALFSAAAATTLFWFMRRLRLPLPRFWTFAAFAFSMGGLLRYNLVKANALALIFLLLALWAMLEGRWKTVLVIAAIFTLTYGAALLLPALAGLFTLVKYAEVRGWLSKWAQGLGVMSEGTVHRFPWRPMAYTLAGMALGLLSHPQFPTSFSLFTRALQVINRPPSTIQSAFHEWNVFDPRTLLVSSLPLVALWAGGIGLRLRRGSWTGLEAFVVSASIFMLALTLRHGRFVEYWAPFAAFSAAITLREKAHQWSRRIASERTYWWGVLILASIPIWINIGVTAVRLRAGGQFISVVKNAVLWLAEHSEEGAIVFHTRWDQFPHLFFWNQRNYYITGLDPVYVYFHDPGLHWQLWHFQQDHAGICKAEHCGPMSVEEQDRSIAEAIVKDFRASYVLVVKKENPQLNAALTRQSRVFRRVYEDPQVIIYKVHP